MASSRCTHGEHVISVSICFSDFTIDIEPVRNYVTKPQIVLRCIFNLLVW